MIVQNQPPPPKGNVLLNHYKSIIDLLVIIINKAHSGAGSWQNLWTMERRAYAEIGLLIGLVTPWKGLTLEQLMKHCSLWEELTLEKSVEGCLQWKKPHTGAGEKCEVSFS